MTLLNLAAGAEALLALVETTADEEGITLPERRYVSCSAAGNEPFDCDQVVVALLQVNPANSASGNPAEWASGSGGGGGTVQLPEMYMRVEIVRGVPVSGRNGQHPPAEDEHARGVEALHDAALLHAVRSRVLAGADLTLGQSSDVRVGPIVPSGAEGGYAGMGLVLGATMGLL